MNRKALIAIIALALVVLLASFAWAADKRYNKGLKLYNTGKYEEAIVVLKDYISNTPDPKGYYLIGYSLYKLGRHEEADQYFKQSYLVQPEYTPTPTLEKDGRKLKHVRPQGYYEGKIEQGPTASGPEIKPVVPEGYMAVEQPSTLSIPAPAPQNAPAVENTPAVANTAAVSNAPAVTNAPAAQASNAPAAQASNAPAAQGPTKPEKYVPKTATPPPSAKSAGIAALLAGGMFLIILLALTVGMYLFTSFCLFKIAKKLEVSPAWLAFIPIANIITIIKCADKPVWWIVLLLIPLVGLVVWVYLWMLIAINLGRGKFFGIALALVPVVNIILLAMLAFSGGGGPSKPKSGGGKPGKGGKAKKGEESTGEFMADDDDLDLPDVPSDLDFDADEFK